MHPYITGLIQKGIAVMGSNWVEDGSVKDGPIPGYRYDGKKPVINCNDLFYWAVSDSEDITEDLIDEFKKAITDCNGNEAIGAELFCARMRKMRPQGACYAHIQKDLWGLFDRCGDVRDVGFGNPYERGDTMCRESSCKVAT